MLIYAAMLATSLLAAPAANAATPAAATAGGPARTWTARQPPATTASVPALLGQTGQRLILHVADGLNPTLVTGHHRRRRAVRLGHHPRHRQGRRPLETPTGAARSAAPSPPSPSTSVAPTPPCPPGDRQASPSTGTTTCSAPTPWTATASTSPPASRPGRSSPATAPPPPHSRPRRQRLPRPATREVTSSKHSAEYGAP